MPLFRLLACAGILLIGTSGAYFAFQSVDRSPNTPGLFWDNAGHGQMVGVPGPIAGAGLPLLVVAGAYIWVRNRRRSR